MKHAVSSETTKARRENIEITSDRLTVSLFHLIISQPGEKLFFFAQPMMQSHSTQCLPFFSFLLFYFFNIFIVFPSLASVHAVKSGNPLEDIIQPIRQGNSRVESRKKGIAGESDDERGGGEEEKRSKFRWCRGGNKKTEKGKTMKE